MRAENCDGSEFETSYPGVDLWAPSNHLIVFNDAVRSFQCNGPVKRQAPVAPSVPGHWEWSPQTQLRICSQLDQLEFGIQLASDSGDGTFDTLKLDFFQGSERFHLIAESPGAGFHEWQDIDIHQIFKSDTVDVRHLRGIRLFEIKTSFLGGDEWKLIGIKLKGRCAGSGVVVEMNRHASLDKTVKLLSPHQGELNTAWQGFIDLADWIPKPACSHFSMLNAGLHLASRNWAGTYNDLYVLVSNERYRIAHDPYLGSTSTILIKPQAGSGDFAVADLKKVVLRSEGGHDAALPEKMILQGFCAGSHTVLQVETTVDTWIADGEDWTWHLSPESWVEL
ncbi:hypothetical protein CDD83_7017 [Cordyceps sp. RAO-2017]|nr:hypothetical protein CDD83_7017 [Cordyceps sp. RAO-2017]